MAEAKVVQDQYLDRIRDLAENAEPMKKVLKAMSERDNELGKTDEEKAERWKGIISLVDSAPSLVKRIEACEKLIADRKITFGNQPDEKELRKLFTQYVFGKIRASKQGGNDPSILNDVLAKTAMTTVGSAAVGEHYVPSVLLPIIATLLEDEGIVRSRVTVVPMGDSMSATVPQPGSVSLAWQTEGATATDQAPTTAATTLTAKTLIATLPISRQLLRTSRLDLIDVYVQRFIRRMGREEEKQVLVGTTPFTGISTAASVNEVVMTAGLAKFSEIEFTNITALIAKLSNEALRGAEFFMHPTMEAILRDKEDTEGTRIWAPPGQAQPATIYGIPYVKSAEMTASTGADQASVICLMVGNLENFLLGEVDGFELAVSDEVDFKLNNVVMRVTETIALAVGDATAFGRVKTGTA